MADQSLIERIKQYQPPRVAVLYSFGAGVALTLVLGFTVGGWVTGDSAREMTDKAVGQARADLAAAVCVERFLSAQNAGEQLAALERQSRWRRRAFIEDGGWVTLAGMEQPVSGAAVLCANRLMEMEVPVMEAGSATDA